MTIEVYGTVLRGDALLVSDGDSAAFSESDLKSVALDSCREGDLGGVILLIVDSLFFAGIILGGVLTSFVGVDWGREAGICKGTSLEATCNIF